MTNFITLCLYLVNTIFQMFLQFPFLYNDCCINSYFTSILKAAPELI